MKLGARHIARALSSEHHDPALGRPRTPAALEAHAMRQATRLGVSFRTRPRWAANARFAIAGPRKIHLPWDFRKRDTRNRAALLMHELVHVRQWQAFGVVNMAGKYAFQPRWRAALEIEAYAETFRAHTAMGWRRREALAYRIVCVERLAKHYGLRSVDYDQLVAVCVQAWRAPA